MNSVDVEAWVRQAPQGQQGFREAIHIILAGIGNSPHLQATMVMKGGLLMAIRHDSSRYTRDIDFSTTAPYTAEDARLLREELERQLALAADRLPYGTACRLQSGQIDPPGEGRTHQSLKLKIGYANVGHPGAMKRLLAGQAAQVVEIDHSYNEAVLDVEAVQFDGGSTIRVYSLHNVLAEKMRSLLQQPLRKRHRRQDVYDIGWLLASAGELSVADLADIHRMLVVSCRSKGIEPGPASMEADGVVSMARHGYEELRSDVAGALRPFDQAMATVQALYRALPWP